MRKLPTGYPPVGHRSSAQVARLRRQSAASAATPRGLPLPDHPQPPPDGCGSASRASTVGRTGSDNTQYPGWDSNPQSSFEQRFLRAPALPAFAYPGTSESYAVRPSDQRTFVRVSFDRRCSAPTSICLAFTGRGRTTSRSLSRRERAWQRSTPSLARSVDGSRVPRAVVPAQGAPGVEQRGQPVAFRPSR